MHIKILAGVVVLFGLAACQGPPPPPTKETSLWWSDIALLGSDRLQGRLTGSAGYREASRYVADSFQKAGLEPAGAEGYFQSVAYDMQTILADRSTLSLSAEDGLTEPLSLGEDMLLDARVEQPHQVTAPLVFVGYGLRLPEGGYDDFADVDLRGKIAVLLSGAPSGLSGPLQAYARAESFAQALRDKGAVGAIAIQTPAAQEVPWERVKLASRQPGMYLTESDLRRYPHPTLIGSFNGEHAERLFLHAPQNFAALVALAEQHQPMPHFSLGLTLDATIEADHVRISADNVVAELPGSDPSLAAQAVVLTAHLDHLGTGQPDHGDGVFHGAMDNASGVASLLEIARALQAEGIRPKRSILFVVVGGEEKGLLGSRYFAAHPTRHVGDLVADINMDMFLPLFPMKYLVALGADESSLGDEARLVTKRFGVTLLPDPQPDHLYFVRSDQYSFIRRGIPALLLKFAALPGSPEAALQNAWMHERYHSQSDDLGQPVDLVAADQFDRLMVALIAAVANQPQAPSWRSDSFFRRFAETPLR